MKSPQRTERRLLFLRPAVRRRRALLVEQLEARNLLCYGFSPTIDPPPDSYRSEKVSDYVGQVAYEFEQWLSEPIIRDFRPTNCEAVVRDGRMLVEAIAMDSGADLAGELTAIDAEVVGSYEWLVSAWVPLVRLTDLKALQELRFVKLLYDHTTTNQLAAELPAGRPLSPVAADTFGDFILTSQIPDLPDIFDDYSDVPAEFRSSRVSDLLARAAFEFSQRPPTVSVNDFVASDAWVTVRDGNALVQAVSTSVSGEKLGESLAAMGAQVLGSYGPGVSAWFPLAQIPALGNLDDLSFASPGLLFTDMWRGDVTPEDGMLRSDQLDSGGLNEAETDPSHDVHTEFPSQRVRDSLADATIALPHRSPTVLDRDVSATAPWAPATGGFPRMQVVITSFVGEVLKEDLTSECGTMQGSEGQEVNAPRARQRICAVANRVDLTSAALVLDGAVTDELDLDRLFDLAERSGCLEVGGMRPRKP